MFIRRYLKEIKGTVYLDSNHNGRQDQAEPGLKNIGIRLYAVGGSELLREGKGEIRILREKQIWSTKTNEQGEFRFIVSDGAYSVGLDAGTLPEGLFAMDAGRHFKRGESGSIHFAVRDAVSDTKSSHAAIVRRKNPAVAPDMCETEKISAAYRSGAIDEHKKILYTIYALKHNRKLPEEYRSRIPVKSGTRCVEEIRRYAMRADSDPEVVEEAQRALSSVVPVLDKAYRSPSGYFNIHYTLSGENAVAYRPGDSRDIPEYIRQVGLAFDQVKAITCTTRGFREPILEDGKNAYDVYVYDLKDKYGVTYSSQIFYARNAGEASTASSYICIDNSYAAGKGFDKSREDCMRVTAAHEFFHAVQYAYNVDSDLWWKEASATWNEDEIFTGVNDYVRYVGRYLSSPAKSLDESSYSGVIFVKFLSENYGGYNMVKKIWERHSAGYDNSVAAIDTVIREDYGGSDIGKLFDQFSAYNISPAQYYKEGALWKASAAVQHTYSSYPVAVNLGQLNHLSSSYQQLESSPASEGKSLKITVEGAKGTRWGFKLQKRNKSNQLYSITEILSSGAFNKAEITLENFGELYDRVVLIPANLEKERNGLPYTYSAGIN